jgi:hypothetical protein
LLQKFTASGTQHKSVTRSMPSDRQRRQGKHVILFVLFVPFCEKNVSIGVHSRFNTRPSDLI